MKQIYRKEPVQEAVHVQTLLTREHEEAPNQAWYVARSMEHRWATLDWVKSA
jgi:hypothetical protein